MASTNSNVETMSKIVATLVDALEKMEVSPTLLCAL